MKLYRLEYSSYDGCNGWSSWYGDKVFTDKEKALKAAKENESTYVRCCVNEFESED